MLAFYPKSMWKSALCKTLINIVNFLVIKNKSNFICRADWIVSSIQIGFSDIDVIVCNRDFLQFFLEFNTNFWIKCKQTMDTILIESCLCVETVYTESLSKPKYKWQKNYKMCWYHSNLIFRVRTSKYDAYVDRAHEAHCNKYMKWKSSSL